MNLPLIFLTGLTTGALSCLAVQGGLLTSAITNRKEQEIGLKLKTEKLTPQNWLPVGMFLSTKLVTHIILGLVLGSLGSVMSMSVGLQISFQLFTALFMLATAANLLDLHPIFRHVIIQPPRFITRRIRLISKDTSLFAPALLGAFTVFIPCGVTQAMAVLAINSGSAVQGALIMGAFVLGTSPLFALLGVAVTKLSDLWHNRFLHLAAYALIAMSLYAINGVLVVMDAPLSVQKLASMYHTVKQFESDKVSSASRIATNNGVQFVNIDVLSHGYSPNFIQVQRNIPVNLTLKSSGVYSCASAFVFREFGISTMLKPTDEQSFTFTPTKPGRFTFACSMGMYTGTLEVI